MRRAVPFVLVVGLMASAGLAEAKLCGDDVGGQDVPCACGDVLVSDLTLAGDPLLAAPCEGDGLLVRATEAAQGVTIDLRGATLRGGERGTGIWIVDGGPGGARVVSSGGRGAVEGFRDGIAARGGRSVARVENVDVRAPKRDGLRLHGDGYEVSSVVVEDAGRDGITLGGRDYRCHGSRASRSGRFGFQIDGRNAIVGRPLAGNLAEDGGNDGFHLMGSGHRLAVAESRRNRRDGISVRGSGFELTACNATGNGMDGISGEGGDLGFFNNRADDNGRNGLVVSGVRLVDGGGNAGSGNRGEGQQRPAIQCAIDGTPCKP